MAGPRQASARVHRHVRVAQQPRPVVVADRQGHTDAPADDDVITGDGRVATKGAEHARRAARSAGAFDDAFDENRELVSAERPPSRQHARAAELLKLLSSPFPGVTELVVDARSCSVEQDGDLGALTLERVASNTYRSDVQ